MDMDKEKLIDDLIKEHHQEVKIIKMGVTYDNDFWKECVVTYTDTKTGEVETSPLRLMQTNK